jgi:transposase
MWTSRNRARYDRSKLRYPSNVYVLSTGCQWRAIPERPAAEKHGLRLF